MKIAVDSVHPDTHRENILDWISYLTVTGYLEREGDTIAAADVRQFEAMADRTRRAVARDAHLMPSLRSEQIWSAGAGPGHSCGPGVVPTCCRWVPGTGKYKGARRV